MFANIFNYSSETKNANTTSTNDIKFEEINSKDSNKIVIPSKVSFIKIEDLDDIKFMTKVYQKIANDIFPHYLFNNWENVVLAGGYVLELLSNSELKSKDVDFFIFNCNTDKVKQIANEIKTLLGKVAGTVIRECKSVITLCGKNRHIQIINASSYLSTNELLNHFDISVCKVAFNGHQFYVHPSAIDNLKNKIINIETVKSYETTEERIYRYIIDKGFGLVANQSTLEKINPLYLFTQTSGLEFVLRCIQLQQPDMLNLYTKFLIIQPPKMKATEDSSYAELANSKALLKDKGLSSCISKMRTSVDGDVNLYGIPVILDRIKKQDKIDIDELHKSQDKDIYGFHVTCYLIFYNPSDEYIINFMKNSHLLHSKNINQLGLSYLELACLLGRFKLVKFLLKPTNYRTVMDIAVHMDNVELYDLAYKTNNSEDRYLYTREILISKNASNILLELYQEKMPVLNSVTNKIDVNDKIKEILDGCQTVEDFILNYKYLTVYNRINLNDIISSRVPSVLDEEISDMPAIYSKVRNIMLENTNRNCDKKYKTISKILNLPMDRKINTTTLLNINQLEQLINIENGTTDFLESYCFDSIWTNILLVSLDNIESIKKVKNTAAVINWLTSTRATLGPNLESYYQHLIAELDVYVKYKDIMGNNNDHMMAYQNNKLSENYIRKENRIGYSPDDIILWRCLDAYRMRNVLDYKDEKFVNLRNSIIVRSKDTRCITNCSDPIIKVANKDMFPWTKL